MEYSLVFAISNKFVADKQLINMCRGCCKVKVVIPASVFRSVKRTTILIPNEKSLSLYADNY